MNKFINVTLFLKPNGRREQIQLTNINSEDADFINSHKIKVSLEELDSNNFCLYFDYGKTINNDPNEEPDELMELSFGRTCEETISKVVNHIKELI